MITTKPMLPEGFYSHDLILQRGDTLITMLGSSIAIENLLDVLDD